MQEKMLQHSQIKLISPCIGLCSTTYGDLVCLGCKRLATEVLIWPSASLAAKQAIWKRISTMIKPIMAEYFIVYDKDILRESMRRLQINHYASTVPLHSAWILLRKRLHTITSETLADYGIKWNKQSPTKNLQKAWNDIQQLVKIKSLEALSNEK